MKMDNESLNELKNLDCNCNDCAVMVRDSEKRKKSLEFHHKMQLDYFNTIRSKLIEKAKKWKERGYLEQWDNLMTEAESMKFQFDQTTAALHFGHCGKLNKDVSFIPRVLQLKTQNCYESRNSLPRKIRVD